MQLARYGLTDLSQLHSLYNNGKSWVLWETWPKKGCSLVYT